MTDSSRRDGIQSLEIGLAVFKHLYEIGRPTPLHELSSGMAMHRAKLHRYLASLVRAGFVSQDDDRRYALGPYALRMMGGETRLARQREAALGALPSLAREIGETVFLTEWRGGHARLLHFEEPLKPISVRPNVGAELPLLNSSPGRVFAAFLPADETETLLAQEIEKNVPAAQRRTRMAAYRRELAELERRGVARSLAERFPSINSMSAPVYDQDRRAVFAITAFGLRDAFDATWNGVVARALREWAALHSATPVEGPAVRPSRAP
jgi:DNA-binding IclR family transcriptional regulator